MSKIFVSYNRKAGSVVKNLAEDIESLGHTAWFDHELSGGQAWWDQILATIRDCSVFVFVLSPEGLNSTACKREYSYAAALGKPVLPVLVSDGVSLNLLPPALSKIEFVDYRQQDREAAFRLARALNTIPPAAPLPDPLPKSPEAPISYLGGLTEQVDSSATLSYQEQTALLTDLRRSLRDSENTQDARILLQKLRQRRDLFATIADDIDELCGLGRKEKPTPPEKVQTVGIQGAGSFPYVENPYAEPKKQPADSPPRSFSKVVEDIVPGDRALETAFGTRREKAWAAIEGAIMGFVSGITLLLLQGFHPPMALLRSIGFALSGAIAGAIAATRVERVVAIAAGTILAFVGMRLFYFGDVPMLVSFSFPPLCALATRFFARRAR